MRTENTLMNRKLVIDCSLVANGYLFASHHHRCLYLGKSVRERPHWLEANPGTFRLLEDVEKEAAQLGAPSESKNNIGAALAEPSGQTSSHDVAKEGDDENDVASVDTLAVENPTSLPAPALEIIKNETKTLEPLRRAETFMSEADGSKTETTTPLRAMGRRRGRSGGRQIKMQNQPEEVAKAGGMRSPERMRIVLDSLREYPILCHAASNAGIHPNTLAYRIKRSEAGDAGYDIEWQGLEARFH